jgi:hypothetical protein
MTSVWKVKGIVQIKGRECIPICITNEWNVRRSELSPEFVGTGGSVGCGFEVVIVVKIGGVKVVLEGRDDGGGLSADVGPVHLACEKGVRLDVLTVHLTQAFCRFAQELFDQISCLGADCYLSCRFFHDLGKGDLVE